MTNKDILKVAMRQSAVEIVGDNYIILFLTDNSKADKCYWHDGEITLRV